MTDWEDKRELWIAGARVKVIAEDDIEEQIRGILQTLEAEDPARLVVLLMLSLLLFFVGVIWLVGGGSLVPVLLMAAGALVGVPGWVLLESRNHRRSRAATQKYNRLFPTPKDRLAAEQTLLQITSDKPPVNAFRRTVGVLTPNFKCAICGKRPKVRDSGRVFYCRTCAQELTPPSLMPCPFCGSSSVTIATPEEQVAAVRDDGRAKTAGSLIFGPVGLIAGALWDVVLLIPKSLSRQLEVAVSSHLFVCAKCKGSWATKLYPVAEQLPRRRQR